MTWSPASANCFISSSLVVGLADLDLDLDLDLCLCDLLDLDPCLCDRLCDLDLCLGDLDLLDLDADLFECDLDLPLDLDLARDLDLALDLDLDELRDFSRDLLSGEGFLRLRLGLSSSIGLRLSSLSSPATHSVIGTAGGDISWAARSTAIHVSSGNPTHFLPIR